MNYGGKQTKAEKNWSKLHYSHAFISQKLTDEGAKLRRFFFFFFFFRKLRSWSCLYHAKDKVIEEQKDMDYQNFGYLNM